MSDIRTDVQFWQLVAGAVGTGLATMIVGLGRRAGAAAGRQAAPEPAGDDLQRNILAAVQTLAAEMRGLRNDWQAKREADEDRRRDVRERSVDEQLDDLRRGQKLGRVQQDDIKILLGEVVRRLPEIGSLLAGSRRSDMEG